MTKECDIVKDLLPLYEENLTSEASDEFIKGHLNACESCKLYLERIERDIPNKEEMDIVIDVNEQELVKGVKNRINKMIWIAILIGGLVGTFSPMMFNESGTNHFQFTFIIFPIVTFFVGMLSFLLVKKLWAGPVVTLIGGLGSAIIFSNLSAVKWIVVYLVISLLGALIGAGIERIRYKKVKFTMRMLIYTFGVLLALVSFSLFIFFTDMSPSKYEEKQVIAQAEEYLEVEYPNQSYEIYDVLYDNMGNFDQFQYAAKVRNLDTGDEFLVYYNDQTKKMEDSLKYSDEFYE